MKLADRTCIGHASSGPEGTPFLQVSPPPRLSENFRNPADWWRNRNHVKERGARSKIRKPAVRSGERPLTAVRAGVLQ